VVHIPMEHALLLSMALVQHQNDLSRMHVCARVRTPSLTNG
jgi:hypothetical protein